MSKTKAELIKELDLSFKKMIEQNDTIRSYASELGEIEKKYSDKDKALKTLDKEFTDYKKVVRESMLMKDEAISEYVSRIKELESDITFYKEKESRSNARLEIVRQLISDESQNRTW